MKKLTKVCIQFTVAALLFMVCLLPFGCNVSAKAIKLNKKTLYMAKGSTFTLKVKGTKSKVKWKSSKAKVVSVSQKGKLKAKKIGTATIVAKVKGKNLKCKVTVESKSAHKARLLRNYILSKGKYNKESKGYVLKRDYVDDESNHFILSITAYKAKNKMDFYYQYKPDAPDSTSICKMSINLISGKAALKKGSAVYLYEYGDTWNDDSYFADITTAFDGKTKGLTLTKIILMEEDYDEGGEPAPKYNEFTDEAKLNEGKSTVYSSMNAAFAEWNKLLKKQKSLKKQGVTMNSIGFAKWK